MLPKKNEKMMAKQTRGHWSKNQHKKFLQGLKMFGKNWKKIQQIVQTRTIIQVRSHAQKYFLQLRKEQQFQQSQDHSLSLTDQAEICYSSNQYLSLSSMEIQKNKPSRKQLSSNLQSIFNKIGCSIPIQIENEETIIDKEREAQNLRRREFPEFCSSNSTFFSFQKESLEAYLSEQQHPSHFLEIFALNYDRFSSGGSFL